MGRQDATRLKLLNDIVEADRKHKLAVKWFMDLNTFGNLFNHEEWRGGNWAELAQVVKSDKDDAIRDIISTRKEIERARNKLIEYDSGVFDGNL